MSSFIPLNVEIEEESEDEIDDSKEIQIEEALKLYQNALKLHSSGPRYYDAAESAYNELFRSEIFTWEESFSEAHALERYNEIDESDDDFGDALTPALAVPATGVDGMPSSLPQILYLAYKNHGQFLLDRLRDHLSRIEHEVRSDALTAPTSALSGVASGLNFFIEALDKDDTDLELWRLVSRIGSFLGSRRIARFCLEAAFDSEVGAFDAWAEPLELEVGFAKEQLRPLLESLDDQVSQSQVSMLFGKDRHVISSFRRRIDPCPYLPVSSPNLDRKSVKTRAAVKVIEAPSRSFLSIGKAILLQLTQEAQGIDESDPGATYTLVIPSEGSNAVSAPTSKTVDICLSVPNEGHPLVMDRRGSLENASRVGNAAVDRIPQESLREARGLLPPDPNQVAIDDVLGSPKRTEESANTRDGEARGVVDSANVGPIQTHADAVIIASLPTRKRSSETAELPESTDLGRVRSKRIKARGSLDLDAMKDSTAEDWAKWYEEQLLIYHQADDSALEAVGATLSKLGSDLSTSLRNLRDTLSSHPLASRPDRASNPIQSMDLVAQDLRSSLDAWDLGKSKAFLHGHDSKDTASGIGGSRSPELAAFLVNSNQNNYQPSRPRFSSRDYDEAQILRFNHWIEEQQWVSLGQLAYRWLEELLAYERYDKLHHESPSYYVSYLWPDKLKETVVQMLVFQDQAIYSELKGLNEETEQQAAKPNQHSSKFDSSHLEGPVLLSTGADKAKCYYANFAQTIFELHLDVYGRITHPGSKVDEGTRTLQRDRLSRWAALASKLINQWPWLGNETEIVRLPMASDDLHVRFLWASVVCNSLLEPAHRDTTILCYQDLIQILQEFDKAKPSRAPFKLELCNNAIMPDISVGAAQKEISRLTTMDFFMGIFNPDNTDPLTTVESLEPLLDLSIKHGSESDVQGPRLECEEATQTAEDTEASPAPRASSVIVETSADPKLLEALNFLRQGNLHFRLFLWQKLRDAYRAVAYPPQVLVCDLRMMAVIVDYLKSSSYSEMPQESRRDDLLRWLHRLDDHVTRALSIALSKADAFDCMDGDHAQTSLEALTAFQKIIHLFALWEDTIRVGTTPAPAQVSQNATKGLAKSTDKFRDMVVKIWTLQYMLLKEVMSQNSDFFESPSQELIKHLGRVHQALGLRCYCSLANKIFLKLMKKELDSFKMTGDWDVDMSQLMYDLYGVKISANGLEMQDHGCLTESLDRRTALEIMDLVMTQVNRISTKDLLKSDLKFTVDKMQQVIMIPKITNSTARTFNFRLTNNYLKSPLNPYDLYRSLRGIGGLCGTPAYDEGSDIAAKGWYSLLGHITLAKFRSTKRSSAGSMDDLNVSKAFLRHDLEFDTDRWETWYRLGQVYDAMIEEETTWTADKLDNHMDELTDLQRKAIHCYSMAIAIAIRCAEGSFEDASKMADLCAEFGTRVYASTREPFSMKAFSLDDHKRHYNSRALGMYQDVPFRTMQLYSAWKFASILLRRASAQKPQNWVTSYTFGKVLWKMHNCSDEIRGRAKRIGYQPAIDAFIRAIEACPERRDSRHPDKDPILEPHYKLLSIVHKLVRSKRVLLEEGRRILQATPYARKAPDFQGEEGWNGYVWQVLKALRAADKANWHHRMVARAAHIMYDDDPGDPRSAVGARNELSQQIFTKTMAIQVWKPDNERPGRHFVYTGKYVRFFTRILYQLNDKASLEALARRIRKRAGDFVNHTSVWEEVCRAYLKLLHHQPFCEVTDGYSENVFQGMDPEIFQLHAARLETHVHSQQVSPPLLDILREAIELKKLNNNLFKPINLFEDLIRDVYAHLYDNIIPALVRNDAVEENRVRMRVDNILSNPTPSMIETPPPDGVGAQGWEQPKKSGARYVTAREIVRKAEAIAAKPAPLVPAKVLKPLAPAPISELGARPPNDTPRLAVVINNDGPNDVASSVPGSVHDSADDESELSEVDDEVADAAPEARDPTPGRPPMFPNLLGASGDTAEEIGEDIDGDQADGEEIEERMDGEEADEQMEGEEPRLDEEMDVEARDGPTKESGVHEGNW